jgi:3-hydroxyisobutyrate dehydrogenase
MTAQHDSSAPLSPDRTRIGFVGIGNMGTPMAGHLVKAGWRVRVYDVDEEKARSFVGVHGGTACGSLAEVGRNSDAVITMLPDGGIVRRVVVGDGASGGDCLMRGLARGAIIIDMSSSAPVGTRELGAELAGHGMSLLDAPVSGGVRGAVAATLAIMVGGDPGLAERCAPLLSAMGRRFYAGTLGSGHAVKVLNNYVSAAGLAAAGEALIIGARFGIEPKAMLDIVNASTGRNNSTENKFAQFIFNKKFNSGFSLGLMAKDLSLAMGVAKAVKVDAELGQACLQLWQEAERELGGRADHTEVVRHIGEL